MIATIVNTIVVALCALVGMFMSRGIPEQLRALLVQVLGICVCIVGLRMTLAGDNDLIIVISVALGTVMGYAMQLDRRFDEFGEKVKAIAGVKDSRFVEGFVSASFLYCVGAMSIVGSFEAGLNGNYSILFTKSVLDGIMSVVLGSTLGIGVAFSAFGVLTYQGALTFLAGVLSPVLTETVIAYLSASGGILIIGIGLSIAEIKSINTINMLPSIFIAAFIGYILPFIG